MLKIKKIKKQGTAPQFCIANAAMETNSSCHAARRGTPATAHDRAFCVALLGKHRAGQRCFELLALIGSPQLSFQRYSQLNKYFGLTGKP